MIYCNKCGEAKGWPLDTVLQCFGVCDICHLGAQECNELDSELLPFPTTKEEE